MTNRIITRAILDRAIERQGHLCFYCQLPFGTVARTKRGNVTQNAVGDHWIPWAFSGNSSEPNAVAACDICNSYKSSDIYESPERATIEIIAARNRSGVRIDWIPETPVTLDGNQWAIEYGQYLTGQH